MVLLSYLDCIFGFNCVWKCKLFSNSAYIYNVLIINIRSVVLGRSNELLPKFNKALLTGYCFGVFHFRCKHFLVG